MTELQQKRLAFLEDEIKFRNSTNRQLRKGGENLLPRCCYSGEFGCAIGRKIANEKLRRDLDSLRCSGVTNEHVFQALPEDLRELGKSFLALMQDLHDSAANWTVTGLSEAGHRNVQKIKKWFDL